MHRSDKIIWCIVLMFSGYCFTLFLSRIMVLSEIGIILYLSGMGLLAVLVRKKALLYTLIVLYLPQFTVALYVYGKPSRSISILNTILLMITILVVHKKTVAW